MYINGKSLDNYNAKLLRREILPSEFEVSSSWSKNSLSPQIDKKVKRKYKKALIGIEFSGSAAEIELNKSRLTNDITISTIHFKALDNNYKGYVVSVSNGESVTGYGSYDIELNVIEEEKNRVIEFKNNITLILNSNQETPCILELTPTINLVDVTIIGLGEDIFIKNLTKDKTIIIDAEKGLVTENGLNKWKDYDSWSFPKLSPGENVININKASINAKLKYKARWI